MIRLPIDATCPASVAVRSAGVAPSTTAFDELSEASPPTLDELRDLCRDMREALAEEAAASDTHVARLLAGARLEVLPQGTRYAFRASAPIDASDGDVILLRVGRREVEGTVSATNGCEVELTLADDLGAVVAAGATLQLEPPWMLQRQRERLVAAFEVGHHTPHLFNLPNAARTMGLGEIDVSPDGPVPVFDEGACPLNDDQRRAVTVALRAPLSVIVAPAGTGKTRTLGALVEACDHLGYRVLVTAPSNIAVDHLMLQACGRLAGKPGFDQGQVLRIGADVHGELRQRFGAQVVLQEVLARLRPVSYRRMQEQQHVVDGLVARLNHALTAPATASEVEVLRDQLTEARTVLRRARRDLAEQGQHLTREARVVGATLARVSLDDRLQGFDVVVIDEASMAQGPAVFLAAGLARKHVVVAGDPYQLAAPVRSFGPHRQVLAQDVFHRLDVVRALDDDERVDYITVLCEQFRSAPAICELLSTLWYGPRLKPAPRAAAGIRGATPRVFGGASLCFLDTAGLNPTCMRPWGRTQANQTHAEVIARLMDYLHSADELPIAGMNSDAVLILSHYRGQVEAVRRLLGDRYTQHGVAVRTVHGAQGAEADTCIFDVTLASPLTYRASSVSQARDPLDDGSRLLAVATSRGRSRLIVVGDSRWMHHVLPAGSVLGRLYAHLSSNAHYISLSEVCAGNLATPLRLVP